MAFSSFSTILSFYFIYAWCACCKMNTFYAIFLVFLLGPLGVLAQNPKKPMIRHSFDLKKTKVWGPGLHPDKIVLPARYFYIEAAQFDGKP